MKFNIQKIAQTRKNLQTTSLQYLFFSLQVSISFQNARINYLLIWANIGNYLELKKIVKSTNRHEISTLNMFCWENKIVSTLKKIKYRLVLDYHSNFFKKVNLGNGKLQMQVGL